MSSPKLSDPTPPNLRARLSVVLWDTRLGDDDQKRLLNKLMGELVDYEFANKAAWDARTAKLFERAASLERELEAARDRELAAADVLGELLALKDQKDRFGKGGDYEARQLKAWSAARAWWSALAAPPATKGEAICGKCAALTGCWPGGPCDCACHNAKGSGVPGSPVAASAASTNIPEPASPASPTTAARVGAPAEGPANPSVPQAGVGGSTSPAAPGKTEAPVRDPVAVGGIFCVACLAGDHTRHSVGWGGICIGCACGWKAKKEPAPVSEPPPDATALEKAQSAVQELSIRDDANRAIRAECAAIFDLLRTAQREQEEQRAKREAWVNLFRSDCDAARAEVEQAMAALEPGRTFGANGSEKPTTLVERARYVVMALGAEADGNTEARAEIERLKAEVSRLTGAVAEGINALMGEAPQGADAARAELADIKASFKATIMGECAPDEKHCSCVPALRAEVAALMADRDHLRSLIWQPDLSAVRGKLIDLRNGMKRHGMIWIDDVQEILSLLDRAAPPQHLPAQSAEQGHAIASVFGALVDIEEATAELRNRMQRVENLRAVKFEDNDAGEKRT